MASSYAAELLRRQFIGKFTSSLHAFVILYSSYGWLFGETQNYLVIHQMECLWAWVKMKIFSIGTFS